MAAEEPKPSILVKSSSSSFSSSTTTSSIATLFSSYLGMSFAVFLGFLPKASIAYISSLQSRNRILSLKLFHVEDQLRSLRSRRKECSKANSRVLEIFAGHRSSWQGKERRLLKRIEAGDEEIVVMRARIVELERSEKELRASVERLEREVQEREEMIEFMGRREEEEECGVRVRAPEELGRGIQACFLDEDELPVPALPPVDPRHWQDVQHDSYETMHQVKKIGARRESPWKVDGDSTGISSKLKLIEQELLNLETVGKEDSSKVPSLMRKQAKRYQSVTGKIDHLCRRMQQQVTDPCDSTLGSECRTQQQTDFLVEASGLQHRTAEVRQKLSYLQAEAAKSYAESEQAGHTILSMKRSTDTVTRNFKEIQRNLEIWLARIIGDVEGTLAMDGASPVRDYYISRYPFVQ